MNNSICCFGEIMMRLTPAIHAQQLHRANKLDLNFAGAESNVASALANWKVPVSMVTKAPNNKLGDALISALQSYGIDCEGVIRGGSRLGVYFIESGSSIRPSHVTYDREYSAISLHKDGFNWEQILQNKQWFHFSGINLAVSESMFEESLRAAQCAKSFGVSVSFDLNYRRSMWKDRALAEQRFVKILELCDAVHGNIGSIQDIFVQSTLFKDLNTSQNMPFEQESAIMQRLSESFDIDTVAFTTRKQDSATKHLLSACLFSKGHFYSGKSYHVESIDRFGTGDAFAAGILYQLFRQTSAQDCLDFALAAFALKHTIYGDQFVVDESEVTSIVSGNTNGHVLR